MNTDDFKQTLIAADADDTWIVAKPVGVGWAEILGGDNDVPKTVALSITAARAGDNDETLEQFMFIFPGEQAWADFLITLMVTLDRRHE